MEPIKLMKTTTTKHETIQHKQAKAKRQSNYPNKTVQELYQTNRNQNQEAHVCSKQHSHA